MLKFISLICVCRCVSVASAREKRNFRMEKERAQLTRSGIDFRLKIPLVSFDRVCIFSFNTFRMRFGWIVGSMFFSISLSRNKYILSTQ